VRNAPPKMYGPVSERGLIGSRAAAHRHFFLNSTASLIWTRSRLALGVAARRRYHHPARVAGLRVKRTWLTTTAHTMPMMGETNRE
jgi:hypothetical protein